MKKISPVDILFFAIPFTSGIIYLLAFFPGILTFDSITQWDQATRLAINNWHPAYHTILIWFLQKLKYSPVVVALFQVILFSSVLAYGLQAFRVLGVPVLLLVLLDTVISVIPLNSMTIITLWKDVWYGFAVLLLAIMLLKIITSNGDWLARKRNWVILGLVLANVSLLRHNGFPVALGSLLAVLIFIPRRKEASFALAIGILYFAFIIGPVYEVFHVDRKFSQSFGIVLVHPIAAYIHSGAALLPEEAAYLNKIFPLRDGWPYSCYDASVLFYEGVEFQPVLDNPVFALKIYNRLFLASPGTTARHFLCLSSFVWQLDQPKDVYLESIVTESQSVYSYPQYEKYAWYTEINSKLPTVRAWLLTQLDHYASFDPHKISWRPALYLYLFCASVSFYAYRARNKRMLILLVPALIQTLVIAFTAQLQAVRYQYPVYLISMLFSIPLFYLALNTEKAVNSKAMDRLSIESLEN